MKVLLVDDSNDKIDKVIGRLVSEAKIAHDDIDVAYTAFDGRKFLSETTYDLVILDIVIPFRPGDQPKSETAAQLLTELRDRRTLKKPRHILGLTAYEEGLRALEPIFQQQAWAIIKYAADTTAWAEQIVRTLRWIADVDKQCDRPQYGVDVCIVTALDIPEYAAVIRSGWEWEPAEPVDDTTFARRGRFLSGGREFSALAAHSPRMGMVPAALLTAKLIAANRPKYIAMAGICAGVKAKTGYGDPILADPCWDWQSGKHVLKEGTQEFEIAPDPIATPERVRSRWEQLKNDKQFWARLKEQWPDAPDNEIRVRIGPAASGSSVLADGAVVEAIKRQHRALIGVEMEGYGLLSAARTAPSPRPAAFVLKSVCDFADEKKDDRWQSYAAFTSSKAIQEFFERYMHELDELAG